MSLEQIVIPQQEHQLPIDRIDTHALYILEKLKAAGYVAYLVGGSVRDLYLGRRPKDFDISTSARPEEIKRLFRNCILIGRRFRLAHIRFGKKIFEVSTFRAGDPETEELIVRDNEWGYPEEDAKRRDFTINGLFFDPFNETIIDYVEGYKDLKSSLLRTIGPPYARFKQDPVRMLRLLKFQARFSLEIDPDTRIALVECQGEITKSSSPRILEEVLRMLESAAAEPFIRLLNYHGLLSQLIPEMAHFIDEEPSGLIIYSYLEEIDQIFKDTKTPNIDRAVLLSALTFPLLQKRLNILFLDHNEIPHLGLIEKQIRKIIHEVFNPFLLLPRRIRVSMEKILLGQFRLTPLHKRKQKVLRIPKDSEFHLAIQFLGLRACLEPGLKEIYLKWKNHYDKTHTEPEAPPKRRRRRRRRR